MGADEASDWIEWIEDIPYPQTREYVRSVLENIEIYDFGGASAPRGGAPSSRGRGLPPSLGGEFAEKREILHRWSDGGCHAPMETSTP